MPPNDFFSKLSKFIVNFNRCKQENDSRDAAAKVKAVSSSKRAEGCVYRILRV